MIALPLLMLAPALWNGYPLLQWDTGGYLARWYEGYLVPSRSTVFGVFLHLGETSGFWLNLAAQSLATLWLLQLTLRVLGQMQLFRFAAIALTLVLATALPWLASMLLTDIFAGLSVLSLFLLVTGGTASRRSRDSFCSASRPLRQPRTAQPSACCSVCAVRRCSHTLSCARAYPYPALCRAA